MSQALLNPLPTSVAPGLPNAAAQAGASGRGGASGQEPGSEVSFARTLERQMKGRERTPSGDASDADSRPEPARQAAPGEASAKPAEGDHASRRAADSDRDAGGRQAVATAADKTSAPAPDHDAEAKGLPTVALDAAAEAATAQAEAAGRRQEAPETAASLAALLPDLAARSTQVAAANGSDAAASEAAKAGTAKPTGTEARPPALHTLEQLLADILPRMSAAATSRTDVPAPANGPVPAGHAAPQSAAVLAALRSASGAPSAAPAGEKDAPAAAPAQPEASSEASRTARNGGLPAADPTPGRQGGSPAQTAPAAALRSAEAAPLPAASTTMPAGQGGMPEGLPAAATPTPTPATGPMPDPGLAGAGLHGSTPGTARSEQTAPPQLPVPTPAGHKAWADDVGDRVMWMVGRNDAKAELVLTPANLGKIEVSIQVSGDQTTAHFVAASAAARDALEQAMPRLREVLQQAGIQLGQANVSTSGEQQARDEAAGRSARRGRGLADDGGATEALTAAGMALPRWREGTGMVDTFA